jgi:hypothetical protein
MFSLCLHRRDAWATGLMAILDENSSVGRASVQWGGRPRPPTDMAARDGRPTNPSHFLSFAVSVRK